MAADKSKRKQYLYPPEKQHASVRDYVRNNWSSAGEYIAENSERLLREKSMARMRGQKYNGHGMIWAEGDLKSKFDKSLGKAMSGGNVNKEKQRLTRLGKPASVKKIRKHYNDMHKVKYGSDPYHS